MSFWTVLVKFLTKIGACIIRHRNELDLMNLVNDQLNDKPNAVNLTEELNRQTPRSKAKGRR